MLKTVREQIDTVFRRDPAARFPRLTVRPLGADREHLFGPFRGRAAAGAAIEALHSSFPLRPCDYTFEPAPDLPTIRSDESKVAQVLRNLVSNALKFTLRQENRDGTHPGFLHNPNASPHGPMYGHAFGVQFLADAQGRLGDKKQQKEVKALLERAVKLIVDSQNKDGGWRYNPQPQDADISVTACQIAAQSARAHGSPPKGCK